MAFKSKRKHPKFCFSDFFFFLMNRLSGDKDGCFNAHNWHIWAEEHPHALFPRAFQERFFINLWAGLLGNRVVCLWCVCGLQ
jgi:hypothetical protein